MNKKNKEKNKEKDEEKKFKILIIGHDYVGLSAFFHKLKTGEFDPNLPFNIGFNYFRIESKMPDNKIVLLEVYDTKGQTISRPSTRQFFNRADGFILIYSINNKDSFDDLENWLKILKEENSFEKPIFLVGNKNDLEDKRIITKKKGEKYADKNGFMFTECSVKNDSWDDIKSIFERLANKIYEKYIGSGKKVELSENEK